MEIAISTATLNASTPAALARAHALGFARSRSIFSRTNLATIISVKPMPAFTVVWPVL